MNWRFAGYNVVKPASNPDAVMDITCQERGTINITCGREFLDYHWWRRKLAGTWHGLELQDSLKDEYICASRPKLTGAQEDPEWRESTVTLQHSLCHEGSPCQIAGENFMPKVPLSSKTRLKTFFCMFKASCNLLQISSSSLHLSFQVLTSSRSFFRSSSRRWRYARCDSLFCFLRS